MGDYLTNLVQKLINVYLNIFSSFGTIVSAVGTVMARNLTLTAFILVMLVIKGRSFSLTKNIKTTYSK